jgi:type I restriction enzyme M protein
MNVYLHGMDDRAEARSGVDSLAADPGERFSQVLTNPPFGKKSTTCHRQRGPSTGKEDASYERQDFCTTFVV